MKRIGSMGLATKTVVAMAVGAFVVVGLMSATGIAFNPQPDPPGFGLVTLVVGQGIRVNVVCSEHSARLYPPDPCRGTLMFHDMAGDTLASQEVTLRPGQAASLPLSLFRESGDPVGIDPCWIPAPGNRGHAIPSAEVFNSNTGQTLLFMNPAVARLSAFAVNPDRAVR